MGPRVLLLFVLLVGVVATFNFDRPRYKWSPIWLNNHYRRTILHKRFDDDLPRWGLSSIVEPPPFYQKKKDIAGSCAKENSICAFVSGTTGQESRRTCCSGLTCAFSGGGYTCLDLKVLPTYMDYYDYTAF